MESRDYLQFGDLRLPVMGGLYAFSDAEGYDYATYNLAKGKPMDAPVGEKLNTISLSVMLRHYLGDKIKETIETVSAMKASGEPHDLIFINGLYKGKYYIKDVKKRIDKTLPDGTILEYDFTIDISEYVEREVLTANKNTQKQSPKVIAKKKVSNNQKPKIKPPVKAKKANTKVVAKQQIPGEYMRGIVR